MIEPFQARLLSPALGTRFVVLGKLDIVRVGKGSIDPPIVNPIGRSVNRSALRMTALWSRGKFVIRYNPALLRKI